MRSRPNVTTINILGEAAQEEAARVQLRQEVVRRRRRVVVRP